jgi:hypothetical protein
MCNAMHCSNMQGTAKKEVQNALSAVQVATKLPMCTFLWGKLERGLRHQLRTLTSSYGLSVDAGDLKLLSGRWYVTHSGLLGLARRRRCSGIETHIVTDLCEPHAWRWVFRATVYTHAGTLGFTGYGDADPANTSVLVRGAEMRVAETRAVNRALRKAYGIGICSVEELAGRAFANLEGFAPSAEWEFISKDAREGVVAGGSNDLQLHAD